MKVVVTGARGMLGRAVVSDLDSHGHDVVAAGRGRVDVRSLLDCRRLVAPDVEAVVNTAAWTDVDGAEEAEDAAFQVNALGAAHLAMACRDTGARLVQLSTDYVFDGTASTPYDEDDPVHPVSAYGRTKCAGEWAVRAEHDDALVVRTAWLYGPGSRHFVGTMAGLARTRDTVDVVDDQRGQPTTTVDVARYIRELLEARAPAGTYHATSEGEATWYDLARAVFEELGLHPGRVHPTTSAAHPRLAPRPAYSVLGHARGSALGITLPNWRSALADTFDSMLLSGSG